MAAISVMLGRVPSTHALSFSLELQKDVGARDKREHDGGGNLPQPYQHFILP